MKQEYVLLKQENDLLNSLIGQSFNHRTKLEADKILKEIHKQADQRSIEKALCYVVDKGEVKGVGGSTLMKDKKTGEIVSDLILDQFGIFLATLFRRLQGSFQTVNLNDITGGAFNIRVYDSSSVFNNTQTTRGVSVQVGQVSIAPARTDFNINTPFGTAPESGAFIAGGNPVWNSGLGNFKTTASIQAGGSGIIKESVLKQNWQINTTFTKIFTLFRDVISPNVPFAIGQTIALEYTIQL